MKALGEGLRAHGAGLPTPPRTTRKHWQPKVASGTPSAANDREALARARRGSPDPAANDQEALATESCQWHTELSRPRRERPGSTGNRKLPVAHRAPRTTGKHWQPKVASGTPRLSRPRRGWATGRGNKFAAKRKNRYIEATRFRRLAKRPIVFACDPGPIDSSRFSEGSAFLGRETWPRYALCGWPGREERVEFQSGSPRLYSN
jgi:hypothetical protein